LSKTVQRERENRDGRERERSRWIARDRERVAHIEGVMCKRQALKSMMSVMSQSLMHNHRRMGEPAATQAFGVGFTNTVGVVTPTFHQVFRPGKLRTIYAKRKRRKLKARIMPLESIFLKKDCS
jgi:hypothetical protein